MRGLPGSQIGQASQSEDDHEVSKVNVTEANSSGDGDRKLSKANDSVRDGAQQPSSPKLPPQPPRKGTITAYFRPAPAASSSTPLREPSSEAHDRDITPPSSPPPLNIKKRKARRLRTRVSSKGVDNTENGVDTEDQEGREEHGESTQKTATPSAHTDVLVEKDSDAMNQVEGTHRKRRRAGKRGGLSEGPKPPTVQTTLSLSATDTGFTECKDCGMLYNPLHAKDVKDHARRHASLHRAKSRDNET
ncbi:hypothetical protein F4780DRAFT_781643 [Xylariomycetidae sp. FL0641]|nr:hypothetical protein F4780DRAFT_781643 [Xylariomycetidae sp. FL0641]